MNTECPTSSSVYDPSNLSANEKENLNLIVQDEIKNLIMDEVDKLFTIQIEFIKDPEKENTMKAKINLIPKEDK